MNLHPESVHALATALSSDKLTTNDPGLARGLAGISFFLFHYSSFFNSSRHNEAAQVFLVKTVESMITSINIGAIDNVPGVAWNISYLSRNRLIDIDTDDILAQADDCMADLVSYQKIPAFGNSGLIEVGTYFLSRLGETNSNRNRVFFQEKLLTIVDRLKADLSEPAKAHQSLQRLHNENKNSILDSARRLLTIRYFLIGVGETGIYLPIIANLMETIRNRLISIVDNILCNTKSFSVLFNDCFFLQQLNHIINEPKLSITELECYQSEVDLIIEPVRIAQELKSLFPVEIIELYQYVILLKKYGIDTSVLPEIKSCLAEKLQLEIRKNTPAHFGSRVGIPDLGLLNGLAGMGMITLENIQQKDIIPAELLFFNSL